MTFIKLQTDYDVTIINQCAIESIIAAPYRNQIVCTLSMLSGDDYTISHQLFESLRKHLHIEGVLTDLDFWHEDDAGSDFVGMKTRNGGTAIINISAIEAMAKAGGYIRSTNAAGDSDPNADNLIIFLLSQDYVTLAPDVGKRLEAYLRAAHGITDLRAAEDIDLLRLP